MADISIIICTRNRAADLRLTLQSLRGVQIPDGCTVETLIVDNGSSDDTPAVIAAAATQGFLPRHVREETPGQVYARNTGLALSDGKIIVFTDDDIRFPQDWLIGVCQPIWDGRADAVAGGVVLAPHLQRPWMTSVHRTLLAGTEYNAGAEPNLVGANMLFSRDVLQKVPGFDPALGPGRLGFWDDTLFSHQLRAAGYRIVVADEKYSVEHHFDPSRLQRQAWLGIAERVGRSGAYVNWHWFHDSHRWIGLKKHWMGLKLAAYRARHRSQLGPEGMSPMELRLVQHYHFLDQLRIERQQPPKYPRRDS